MSTSQKREWIFVEGILLSDSGEEFEVPFSSPCWAWEVNRVGELCGICRRTPHHLLQQQMINQLPSSVLSEIREYGKELILCDKKIREEAKQDLLNKEIMFRRYYSHASYVGEPLTDEGRAIDTEGKWIEEYSLLKVSFSSKEACESFRGEVIQALDRGEIPIRDFFPLLAKDWRKSS